VRGERLDGRERPGQHAGGQLADREPRRLDDRRERARGGEARPHADERGMQPSLPRDAGQDDDARRRIRAARGTVERRRDAGELHLLDAHTAGDPPGRGREERRSRASRKREEDVTLGVEGPPGLCAPHRRGE
jgi:hypothetical protein